MSKEIKKLQKKAREDYMEQLAAIEHQRWADWQEWCNSVLRENCPSSELGKVLERWDKQIATPYSKLTEKEKQSDREQVIRYLPIIDSLIEQAYKQGREDEAVDHQKEDLNAYKQGFEEGKKVRDEESGFGKRFRKNEQKAKQKEIIRMWLSDHEIKLPDERVDILITMLNNES